MSTFGWFPSEGDLIGALINRSPRVRDVFFFVKAKMEARLDRRGGRESVANRGRFPGLFFLEENSNSYNSKSFIMTFRAKEVYSRTIATPLCDLMLMLLVSSLRSSATFTQVMEGAFDASADRKPVVFCVRTG